jgi:hypothetical protein
VDAGRIELFIQAADRAAGSSGTSEAAASVTSGSLVPAAEGGGPADPARKAMVLELAGKLLPRVLSPVWRELIAAIAQAEAGERTKHRLTAAILTERVRRASPALALQPQLMRDVAEASFEAAAGRLTRPPAGAGAETAGHHPAPASGEARPLSRQEEVAPPAALGREPAPPHEEPPSRTEPRQRPRSTGPEPAGAERPPSSHSRHAGLWLVVPSLIRIGFREWLTQQAGLLGENPGHELLRAIALRHRVPLHDPALAQLDPGHNSEIIAPWAEIWRHALDRWLRHKARRRIHDLVSRPGTIVEGEERIVVQFPLAAADLGLRRLALDSDPGWTDWLGLSIRYQFDGSAQR